MSQFSLDLLGPVILAMHDDVAEIRRRLASLEDKVEQQHDEIVLTGRVMRYAGEQIAWGGMQRELRTLRECVDPLERKTP